MPQQYRAAATPPTPPNPGARPPAIGQGGVIPLPKDYDKPKGGGSAPKQDSGGGDSWLVPDSIEKPLQSISEFGTKAGGWLSNRDNWIRVAKVSIGSVMIIVGLAKLAVPAATNVAAQVTPVGQLVKKVGGK